jgi:hypothetical protein
VRRATGPSRIASGVMVSPATTPATDSPGANRKRARRATGPSRFPRG